MKGSNKGCLETLELNDVNDMKKNYTDLRNSSNCLMINQKVIILSLINMSNIDAKEKALMEENEKAMLSDEEKAMVEGEEDQVV